MPRLDLLEVLRLMAGLTNIGAPGCKTASGLWIDGRNQLALDENSLRRIMDIHRRNCREQRLGIGMQRALKQVLG